MRASTAYFVGAGTIVAAIAIGLGGGIVAGNIMNPIAPKQGPDTSKMAQRAETAAPAATSAPSERVQYVTGSQAFGAVVAAPAQAQAEAKPEAKPDAGTAQANAEPPPPPQTAAVEPAKPTPLPSQATKPAEQQALTDPAVSPDNAYAKASASDAKRATAERRRVDRHERWAERRRYDQRDARGGRDQTDWDDVARNVREDSSARVVVTRPRNGFRWFDADDD